MPSFRELLGNPRYGAIFPSLRRPERLEKVGAEVRRLLGEVVPRMPTSYDLDETYRALRRAAAAPATLSALPSSLIRRAPWVLFEPRAQDGVVLAEQRSFLEAYLAQLRDLATSGALLTLAHCFLLFYPHGSVCFGPLRGFLVMHLPRASTARGRRFRERVEIFSLLKEDGPARFGELILTDERPPDQLLEQAGLTGQLARRGFIERAYGHLLRHAQDGLRLRTLPGQQLDRVLQLSRPVPGAQEKLRFSNHRVRLADSLLLPFAAGGDAVPHREQIQDFVVQVYGDPRLDYNMAHWHGVNDDAKAVVYRWLVETTLEDFFRLLDRAAAQDDDADRQWPYRRAFWTAYLRGGHIRGAWVVLGSQVAENARALLRDQGQSYGRLVSGYNVKPTHAVLLLRIDDLVISEWSHVGKFRVWHADDQRAPKLYRRRYERDDVVELPRHEGPHAGAPTGRWQERLSGYIASQTGITLSRRDYMP